MSNSTSSESSFEIIEREKETYLEELPTPNPDWPPDVRALVNDLQNHLFDHDLRVQDARERCGCRDNNISTRFRFFVGRTPKDYILYHRVELGKQLLEYRHLSVGDISLGLGFSSPSAFVRSFKRRVDATPGSFRKKER